MKFPPLPYALNALEPYVSQQTLEYHYGKHHKGYVSKLNALIQDTPSRDKSVLEILISTADQQVFNNAAQSWNHEFFWNALSPGGGGPAGGDLGRMICDQFGSHSAFRDAFISAGLSRFGSGWIWLAYDGGALKIGSTKNADTPFADHMFPLLTIDVWEHAYYLDYQNRRDAYLEVVIDHLVNWQFAEANLQQCLAGQNFPGGSMAVVTRAKANVSA